MQRTLICGSPRSGNTLMKYLCALGYENSWAGPVEDDPRGFEDNGQNMFFKCPMLTDGFPDFLDLGYNIIYMVRHPRGCWTSRTIKQKKHDKITPGRAERWVRFGKLYLNYESDTRVACVRYEDLVRNPDELQKKLARQFGFKVRRPFSECYHHGDEFDGRKGLAGGIHVGVLRKIDPKKSRLLPNVSKEDERYIKYHSHKWPDTKKLMRKFGYDPDTLP